MRPGIEPTTSWFLVRFVSAAPRWELPKYTTELLTEETHALTCCYSGHLSCFEMVIFHALSLLLSSECLSVHNLFPFLLGFPLVSVVLSPSNSECASLGVLFCMEYSLRSNFWFGLKWLLLKRINCHQLVPHKFCIFLSEAHTWFYFKHISRGPSALRTTHFSFICR